MFTIKPLLVSSLLVLSVFATGCAGAGPTSNVRARHARVDSRAEYGWPSMRPLPAQPQPAETVRHRADLIHL